MLSGGSELVNFSRSPQYDGISVWVCEGRRITLMRNKPKGIPKFNCHSVYLILEQKHGHTILCDQPYDFFKVFVWIGSRALQKESKVENVMQVLEKIIDAHPKDRAKLRVYIEYQYAESFDFLTLF